MNTIRIKCPVCGAILNAKDDPSNVKKSVTCPNCKETISVDEDVLSYDSIRCPKCGEKLEFEFDEDEDEACCCKEDSEDKGCCCAKVVTDEKNEG